MTAHLQRAIEQARVEPDRFYHVLFHSLVSELSELCRGSQNVIAAKRISAMLGRWTVAEYFEGAEL